MSEKYPSLKELPNFLEQFRATIQKKLSAGEKRRKKKKTKKKKY